MLRKLSTFTSWLRRASRTKPDVGQMEIQFCSVRCLRRFLKEAVDELERRIAEVKPVVKDAMG